MKSQYEVALSAVLAVLGRESPDEDDILLAKAIAAAAEWDRVPIDEAIVNLVDASPWTIDGPRDAFLSMKAAVRSSPVAGLRAYPVVRVTRPTSIPVLHGG